MHRTVSDVTLYAAATRTIAGGLFAIVTVLFASATRRALWTGAAPWLAIVASSLVAACSPQGTCRRCATADAGPPDRTDGAATDGATWSTSLRIEPSTVSIDLTAGDTPSVTFQLLEQQSDGRELVVSTTEWRLDEPSLGTISSGAFVASGRAGGVGTIVATLGSEHARATVEVRVGRTTTGTDVPADVASRFTTPVAGSDGADVVYPLEGAFMPRNVQAPDVQWSPVGTAGDVFRVRLRRPHCEVTSFVAHTGSSFRHGVVVDDESWTMLAASDRDEPIVIDVDRLEPASGRVVAGRSARTFELARGSLYGAVYYWNLSAGDVRRIDPEGGPTTDLIPSPSGGCVACHALSRDGRYLWGTRSEDWQGMMFDLTTDLTADPAPTVYPPSGNYFVASFDPTTRYLIASTGVPNGWGGPLSVIDARTGLGVAATGVPDGRATYPEWSPTGERVAYVGNVIVDSLVPPHPHDTDLLMMPVVAMDPLAFGPPTLVHDGASLASAPEGGLVDCHPSFSPDGRLVAFQHGPGCFSAFSGTEGALYLADLDDGTVTRLDTASGGPTATDSFWPAFAPYTTLERDGHRYHWLGFYSRRDYGNAIAGSTDGNRQIWVAAIDADAPAGDPSRTGYWLPGQSTGVDNLAAQWAPDACRSAGDACGSGADCCSASCLDDVCGDPPPSMCRRSGETCAADSDCCAGLTCSGRRCLEPLF